MKNTTKQERQRIPMTKRRYASQEISLTTKYVADVNAKDIWKTAVPTSKRAQVTAERAASTARNEMRKKAPVMEQYIAMESQTMKTWNALLFLNVASPGIAGTLLEIL